MNEKNVEIVREFIKKSRNLLSKGLNSRSRVLSWHYLGAPRDFYLFRELHLSMKGTRYVDIEDIQR